MKRVLLLVLNNFKNDSRVLKEAISLKKGGYDVQVVALHDRGQKVYEKIEEIPVHRIELKSRNWPKKSFVQLLKYIEFTYRVLKNYRKYEIIHCNDLNTLPIGVLIKFLHKDAKIVYDAHEYETQTEGLSGIQKVLVKWLEQRLIKHANKVITVSNSIASEYRRIYGIEKPTLILNTPPLLDINKQDLFREKLNIGKDKTIFLYQGGLSSGRGIEILLETFKQIDDNRSVIVFMGYGELEEIVKKASREYSNIYYHPAVSPKVLLDYTSSADFGISTIEDSCLSYRYCLPNKMFEYLMARLPVVVSNLPEMKKIVEEYKVGVIAKDNTPEVLQNAIMEASRLDLNMIQENIEKVREIYNWQEQEKVLLDLYKRVANGA